MLKSVNNDCRECSYFNELMNQIEYFQNISEKVIEKKPIEKLLDEIIKASKALVNAEASTLLLYDAKTDSLHFHIATGPKGDKIESGTLQMGSGIAGWVAEKKTPVIIDDCYADERFNKEYDKVSGFKTKNMICLPMLRKDGLIGVIQVMNKIGEEKFHEEDVQFLKALAGQCAIAIENARLVEIEIKSEQLKYELETARSIQQNILPHNLPEYDDIDVEVELIPAKEVGGDYYNVLRINENNTLIFVADVTGKSISAALIVSTIYSFIQTYLIINSSNFDLINFVDSLNRFLINATTDDKFVTAWFGLYDHKNKTMESVSAGHNPTYLLSNGSVTELKEGGLFLGSLEFSYTSQKIQLAKNDKIVFYTDGITEAMNENEEEYGDETFKEFICCNKEKTSHDVLKEIIHDVNNFKGKAEQSDDITCGVLTVK